MNSVLFLFKCCHKKANPASFRFPWVHLNIGIETVYCTALLARVCFAVINKQYSSRTSSSLWQQECVCSRTTRSAVYLARSLFNPAVKSFTDAAGNFGDAQGWCVLVLCVCVDAFIRIQRQEVSQWPPPTPVVTSHTQRQNACNKSAI